jgi:hypothetical protein
MITNIFRGSNVRVAFTTANKLSKHINYRTPKTPRDQFSANGVYQLECPTCNKRYVGQTGHPLRPDIKNTIETTDMIPTNLNMHNMPSKKDTSLAPWKI